MVNAFADRDWTPGVNAELADFSARRSQVVLADWCTAIAPHADVLADDSIHPGPTGGRDLRRHGGLGGRRACDRRRRTEPRAGSRTARVPRRD